jgi:hypothetical protein
VKRRTVLGWLVTSASLSPRDNTTVITLMAIDQVIE